MERVIKFRQAQVTDAGTIMTLVAELGYDGSVEEVRKRMSLLLDKEEHAVFVAENEGGELVGWIHVFQGCSLLGDPFAEIGGLVVHSSHQGSHIGRRLVDNAEVWARQRGLSQLWVRSNTTRLQAAGFYNHLGFRKNKVQNVFLKDLSISTQNNAG